MLDYVERKRISFPVNWMSANFFHPSLSPAPERQLFSAEPFSGHGIVRITVVLILLKLNGEVFK